MPHKKTAARDPFADPTGFTACNLNADKCSVCGVHVRDGDVMCSNRHQPGKFYPIPATEAVEQHH